MRATALLAALTITVGACVSEPELRGSRLNPGDPLPEFAVALNDGATVSDTDFLLAGGIICFFNTSCADCRRELPVLQRYHQQNPNIVIVCIARSETAESISSFWKEKGLTLPYSPQSDRTVYSQFAYDGIPRTYFINPGGIIVQACGPDTPLENIFVNLQQNM